MKKRLISLLTLLCFSIQTCFGVMVTIIEKDISYSFTKTPGNTVTLESKNADIKGWDVKSENVVLDENNSFVMPEEDVKIEALYSEPTEFALIVDKFGIVTSEYKTVGTEITVSVESNEKYIFTGWSAVGITLTEEQKISTSITFTMPSNAVKLSTLYESNEHTLTVNPGGITYSGLKGDTKVVNAPSQTGYTITYNYNYEGSTNTIARANQVFSNWQLSGGGSISSTNTAQTTYTYGDTDGILTANYTIGSLVLPSATREGYILLGWSLESNATSPTYNVGASYNPTSSTTLYAIWEAEPQKYLLTIDVPAFTSEESRLEGETITLEALTESESLIFKNWTATGLTLTTEQQTSPSITFTMPGNEVTLVANYQDASAINTYTVTYDSNGGIGSMAAQIFQDGVTQYLNANTYTREAYDFLGWSTTADGAVEYEDQSIFSVTEETTLYAVWKDWATIVTGIAVKTNPTATEYVEGNNFDSTGLVLTVTYKDSHTEEISTGFTVVDGDALTSDKTSVTISYAEQTCTIPITVAKYAWQKYSVAQEEKYSYRTVTTESKNFQGPKNYSGSHTYYTSALSTASASGFKKTGTKTLEGNYANSNPTSAAGKYYMVNSYSNNVDYWDDGDYYHTDFEYNESNTYSPYLVYLSSYDNSEGDWLGTLYETYSYQVDAKGSYIENVTSNTSGVYPDNGKHTDGYWYVKVN